MYHLMIEEFLKNHVDLSLWGILCTYDLKLAVHHCMFCRTLEHGGWGSHIDNVYIYVRAFWGASLQILV